MFLGRKVSLGLYDTLTPVSLLNGLVAYWSLDEESGDRADSLGVYTLTDNGVGSTTGKDGNAANFTPTTFLAGAAFSPGLGQTTDGVTWAVWLKRTANPTTNNFADFVVSTITSGQTYELRLQGNTGTSGTIASYIRDADGNVRNFSSQGATLCDDAWHLVIHTWNEGGDKKLHVYIPDQGFSAATTAGTSQLLKDDGGGVRIGASASGGFPWGQGTPDTAGIDAVGIWSHAFDSAERATLYNSGAGKFYPFA